MSTQQLYRALTRLYPRDFRDHYGDDLIQHYAELTRERGALAASARTGLDLVVTLPRYRLETIMSSPHATNTLNFAVAALAIAGIAAIITVDSTIGAVLLIAAAILAITQHSHIARAIRVHDTDRRRRRLKIAAILAVVTAADVVIGFADLGNDESWGTKAVIYGAISYAAAAGAVCFLIAGLLTRRSVTPPATPALN